MSKVIVFGASGILGSALVNELKAREHIVFSPSHSEIDICDEKKVLEYVKGIKPDALINCAAFNKVDECEELKELAFMVNGKGAGNIASSAKEVNSFFCHISTDYVFSGEKKEPYTEDDEPRPLSVYGKSKLRGEELVKETGGRFCIIRTSWLFGEGGENFITKIINKYKNNVKVLKVVCDEIGRPTYSRDLARAIALAVEKCVEGVYHFCNEGAVSWFDFAREVFEMLGEGPELIPVSAREYGLPARRPGNSVLSTDKIEKALGIYIPHHLEALEEYLKMTVLKK